MKTRKLLFYFLILFLTSIIFIGCGKQRQAVGAEDLIYVVADSTEYYQLEGTLRQVFGKVIHTPQPENLFQIRRISPHSISKVKDKKNVIIIAPFNSGSYTSQYINSILDSTVAELVKSDSEFVFNKYDLWAKNQLVSVMTSPTIEQLKMNMLQQHENLLYYFQKISDKRLFESLYNPKYEQKEIEAQLLNDCGWIVYVQADYHLALNKPEDNFVWLRRAPGTDMERWMFVHWIEDASPNFLDKDSIYAERNKITQKYYVTTDETSAVEIADNYITSSEVNFLGRYAIMTQGLWRMDDKSMGGPFINYTFYDEESGRIYMLDGSIYAPKYYKKKLIQQVDVLLQSFKTEHDLSKEKKEDLLDEIQ